MVAMTTAGTMTAAAQTSSKSGSSEQALAERLLKDNRKDKKSDVQEPLIDFTHRWADFNITIKLSKLKTLNKFMPKSLRREIGDEYYPEIRKQLATKDSMHFKEGDASVERYPDGKVKLSLSFPNFIMVIREVTWEQLDELFGEYFGYKAE